MKLRDASPLLLALFSLLSVYILFKAGSDVPSTLSPQGCRMSWMLPSYLPLLDFDISWSPFARRYSTWLYREERWESRELKGYPVLFIHGNAGSSHQVRSIASSATRQFWSDPGVVSDEFRGRDVKPLEFFAVEFNEDFSAFHGPTLASQVAYTSRAIDYILSLYPNDTKIIVMGHSMGGVVATALLPSEHISAIITMSTPHTLPPLRVDGRIHKMYKEKWQSLVEDPTPIVALCGGAADILIPSESCILPQVSSELALAAPRKEIPYRSTVFTSALEGAWTGVGHLEMVWCHQVRWRVARAALEFANSPETSVLDRWLRDGHTLPPSKSSDSLAKIDGSGHEILPANVRVVLKSTKVSRNYLLPIPRTADDSASSFLLYVSAGSVAGVAPQRSGSLAATVYVCEDIAENAAAESFKLSDSCKPSSPTSVRLVPNPIRGQPFPVPNEGSDESEGVVVFETEVSRSASMSYVGVHVAHGDGDGWLVGGFLPQRGSLQNPVGLMGLPTRILIPPPTSNTVLKTHIELPNLVASSLVVYGLFPTVASTSICSDPLLAPLLMQTSHEPEIHWFPLVNGRHVHLHTHSSGPYIPKLGPTHSRGINLTIYSTGCDVTSIAIHVDWWGTIGRLGTRYAATTVSWACGVVAVVLFSAWQQADKSGSVPDVDTSLVVFTSKTLPVLLASIIVASALPWPEQFLIGTRGDFAFVLLGPTILVISTGLVCLSWKFLQVIMYPVVWLTRRFNTRSSQTRSPSLRTTALSLAAASTLTYFLLTWQLVFGLCWLSQLWRCMASNPQVSESTPVATPLADVYPLLRPGYDQNDDSNETDPPDASPQPTLPAGKHSRSFALELSNRNQNMHLLLLMTWLLSCVAPAWAALIRTALTTGFTMPLAGDGNFFKVMPFLALAELARNRGSRVLQRSRFENRYSIWWLFLVLAVIAFLMPGGPLTFDVASMILGGAVFIRLILEDIS